MSGTLGKAAAVACLAGACAGSSPQTRMTSPEGECPEGAVERLNALKAYPSALLSTWDFSLQAPGEVPEELIPLPPEGPITLHLLTDLPDPRLIKEFPRRTKFHGRLFHGKERYFIWLFESETPSGERGPICWQVGVSNTGERVQVGVNYYKFGDPAGPKMIRPVMHVITTDYFGRP